MHYSEEEQLYEMEKMMRSVPNFTSRKHGSIVPNGLDNPDDDEQLIPKLYGEMIRITTATIQNELFQERINQLINEREMMKMTYQSMRHKEVFDKAMIKKNENNYKLIAALYLLTEIMIVRN